MTSRDDAPPRTSSVTGLVLGVVSAVAYLAASLGLRSVAGTNVTIGDVDWAIWVSANKAVPVVLLAWTLVGWRTLRGLPAFPPRRLIVPLMLTGLMMQWGGNVSFQFALSRGGLALTVPLAFSTILVSAAILGRVMLGDPLSPATLLAVGTMMAAITVLSQGTPAATAAMLPHTDLTSMTLAVAAACLSGIAYGWGGVIIRRYVRGNLSHSATIVVLSTTGMLTLGATSLVRIGPQQLLATPPDIWLRMLGAGVATAVAFFAITGAYQHLAAVKVNLLNASQAAMAALAGVLLFGEPNTRWLQAGTVLTIIGLIFSAKRDAGDLSGEKRTLTHPADPPTVIE